MLKLWCDCCKRFKWTRRAKLRICFACRNHARACFKGDKERDAALSSATTDAQDQTMGGDQ